MGDFNINLLRLSEGNRAMEFLTLMYSFGYVPLILRPTRIREMSATLIDNIWINDETLLVRSGIIKSEISDHFPIFSDIVGGCNSAPTSGLIYYNKRIVNNQCKANFANELSEMSWGDILCCNDVNMVYELFTEKISGLFNKCFPIVQRKRKKLDVDKPYINNDLKVLIKQKHKLQKLYYRWPVSYEKEFKSIRNLVNKKLRLAKKKYIGDKLNSAGSTKNIWKILNEISGRKKTGDNCIRLCIDGECVVEPKDVANAFNRYFTTIGATLANNLPHVPDYEQYLTSITSVPLVFNPPSLIEIESILSNIKETTVGHDELPMFIFKDNFMAFSEVLLHLFKLSLQMGEVPDAMKIAKVSCIFKSGDPTSISNYRPISILPSLSKILEKLVYARVMNHLVENRYLCGSQYGFRAQCSTEGALQDICNTIYSSFERGLYCIGVFLDLSKAFDTLDRNILLKKLSSYGIQCVSFILQDFERLLQPDKK